MTQKRNYLMELKARLHHSWFERFYIFHVKCVIMRWRDYIRIAAHHKEHLGLFKKLCAILKRQNKRWNRYTYGGYFYQRYARIGLSGDAVEDRMNLLGMLDDVKSTDHVLDIGSNCGFLALELARSSQSVVALEYNPFLNEVGEATAQHLGLENVTFITKGFESYNHNAEGNGKDYQLIVAHASHATDDKGTVLSPVEFMEKIDSMLAPEGLVSFLSHGPETEEPRFKEFVDYLSDRFIIEKQQPVQSSVFTRQYFVLRKK